MPPPDRHREPGTLFLRLVRACCRERRVEQINFYSISAGGDAAGLVFAAGSIAILVVGVPQFAWYLAVAALTAVVFAVWLHARRALEMRAPTRLASISPR